MEFLGEIATAMFSATSIWSVVARGALWFIIATIIIISTDSPDPEKSLKGLKSNLGFFLMFMVLTGGLFWLLFNYTSQG